MIDPNKMSDEEKTLLEGEARAKGLTLEEALRAMGHEFPKSGDEPDDVVEFSGTGKEPKEPEMRTISFGTEPKQPAEELEVPEPSSAVELPPEAAPEPEPEPEQEPVEHEHKHATINSVCSHCGWDQTVAVIEEPTAKDKLSFLQSVLGAKPYSKNYSVFGGHLQLKFRTLTIKEIDKLYADTFTAQQEGKISTASDYYEYLNRLRMNVQLVSIKGKKVPLHHSLPTGMDKTTNAQADSHWEDFLKEKGSYKEGEGLALQIQDYVMENVLNTEQLLRIVSFECQKFNRLAAKLEARVDDSDFWKETGQLF
jgi:hypothetical protein